MLKYVVSLVSCWLVFAALPAWGAEGWQAGAAKIVITPEQPMWMAGYASRTAPAAGKLTDLHAKALVIKDAAGSRGVLVTLDLIGIDRELGLAIREQIAKKHGLKLSQVMLCTSHTHSGPIVAKNLRPMHWLMLDDAQRKQVSDYAEFLQQQVVKVVDDAVRKLSPCQLSQANGRATFAVNRRNNKEAEIVELQKAGKVVGPSDHDVPVLAVRNAQQELLAIVFGYACHATVLSGQEWCADYPGYAQIALEKQHPGAIAMFWAGCGGDQNPLPRRKVELAEKYGQQLAAAVEAVLTQPMSPISGKLSTQYTECNLPLAKLPTKEELQNDANSKDRYVASRAKFWLQELAANRSLQETYPYPIGYWQLGDDLQWFFLGGEVVVDYALRLKSELKQGNTWVAAYSNDVMAYIPSRRVLAEGGYEGAGAMVYYGLPAVWAETVEADIASSARGLTK